MSFTNEHAEHIAISGQSMEIGVQIFHITHILGYGAAETTYRDQLGGYCIANLDVEYTKRKRGIGKALLVAAYDHARAIDAAYVYSGIISRECLDAMEHVFGEDALEIRRRGGYAPYGEDSCDGDRTEAYLHVVLKGTK